MTAPKSQPKPGSSGQNPSPNARAVSDLHKYDDVSTGNNAHHHRIGTGVYDVNSAKHNHQGGNGEPLLDGTIFSGIRSTYNSVLLKQILDALVKLGASDTTTP